MDDYYSKILEAIRLKLESIDMDSCDIPIEVSNSMIEYFNKLLIDIREYFLSLDSIEEEEEIFFFKTVKPEILGFLLYFNNIHTIEISCPNGSNDTLTSYYQNGLQKLTSFFERNLDFYQYYRAKSSHLDKLYFLRNRKYYHSYFDSVRFIMDKEFSTEYDYKIAKIICNEMLRIYLNKKLIKIKNTDYVEDKLTKYEKSPIKFTGKKSALIEIGYSLASAGDINHGNIEIKEILDFFSTMFNIDLGDYYASYIAMKERKDRTAYLNHLTKSLLKRMNDDDMK